jgi:hypothetical protein
MECAVTRVVVVPQRQGRYEGPASVPSRLLSDHSQPVISDLVFILETVYPLPPLATMDHIRAASGEKMEH